ncbi:MAG: 6-phosphogluconolactonase [Bacteroidales bacterium]
MKSPLLNIYKDKYKLAEKLAIDFTGYVQRLSESKEQVDIALSGGSTPDLFFKALTRLKSNINWEKVRIYWVDERCVPPVHSESNFASAHRELLEPLSIPDTSWFRVRGEDDPEVEAKRYSDLILDNVSPGMTFPVFDLIFLGMGADGHTASIFPGQANLWNLDRLCAVGIHPVSEQKRVTFTGHLINAASRVIFLVTGTEKAEIAGKIISSTGNYRDYPASLVEPHHGTLEWYLDADAAGPLGLPRS